MSQIFKNQLNSSTCSKNAWALPHVSTPKRRSEDPRSTLQSGPLAWPSSWENQDFLDAKQLSPSEWTSLTGTEKHPTLSHRLHVDNPNLHLCFSRHWSMEWDLGERKSSVCQKQYGEAHTPLLNCPETLRYQQFWMDATGLITVCESYPEPVPQKKVFIYLVTIAKVTTTPHSGSQSANNWIKVHLATQLPSIQNHLHQRIGTATAIPISTAKDLRQHRLAMFRTSRIHTALPSMHST